MEEENRLQLATVNQRRKKIPIQRWALSWWVVVESTWHSTFFQNKEIDELKKQVANLTLDLEQAKAIIAQPPPPPPKPAVDEEEYHKLKHYGTV